VRARHSRRAAARRDRLVLSCEHGGNRVPNEHARLFRGAAAVLRSHRGWDPGALDLARFIGRKLGQPVHAVTWCRLLVESNRAPTNPRIWSRFTADLPAATKKKILDRYWWPHRREVEAAIRRATAQGRRVIHVAVHSFTPVLGRERRNADVGLLYDSRRPAEKALCRRWEKLLKEIDPALRVRRNYPYKGCTDGFPAWLRRRHSANRYVGVELELNQAALSGRQRLAVHRSIARSLEDLLRG
jgi:predicted N-formylglutamate amidohydrolase